MHTVLGSTKRCPTCGGVLTVTRDAQGYGTELEQCESVLTCGYFRTLATPRIPAHRKVRRNARAESPRRGPTRGTVRAALLAALPLGEAEALSAIAIAERTGREPNTTATRLQQLAAAGEVCSKKLGASRTAARVFWRRRG